MNATPAQETSDQRGASLVGTSGGFGGSVIEELMRLDKIVRECEHSLVIAERLKARARWQAKWDAELAETREKLANTLRERDWLDGVIARYASSPNAKISNGGTPAQ